MFECDTIKEVTCNTMKIGREYENVKQSRLDSMMIMQG